MIRAAFLRIGFAALAAGWLRVELPQIKEPRESLTTEQLDTIFREVYEREVLPYWGSAHVCQVCGGESAGLIICETCWERD